MAITLGGVSSALVGFSGSTPEEEGKLISSRTIDIITCIYTPLSVLIMAYALFTYEWRARFLRKKQVSRQSESRVITLICPPWPQRADGQKVSMNQPYRPPFLSVDGLLR
jgi:hypothetical protein